MKLQVIKHSDNRRTLTEWISDYPIRMCKVLEVHEDSELGNHYHENKEDFFYLLKGSGTWSIGEESGILTEGDCFKAELGEPHTFTLKASSILLESSTTPYDKEDEIPIG